MLHIYVTYSITLNITHFSPPDVSGSCVLVVMVTSGGWLLTGTIFEEELSGVSDVKGTIEVATMDDDGFDEDDGVGVGVGMGGPGN